MKRALSLLLIFLVGCLSTPKHRTSIIQDQKFESDNLYYGDPGMADIIIDRPGFANGYSFRRGQPLWVSYRLTANEVTNAPVSRANSFTKDPLFGTLGHTTGEYSGSGYDRGHLAPSADMKWSTNSMINCFRMSNMSPQVGRFNQHSWERLESWTRETAIKEGSIFIYCGPIFGASTNWIGNKIVVPEGFYKIIYSETNNKLISFRYKNNDDDQSIKDAVTGIRDIESVTDLRFFPEMGFIGKWWLDLMSSPSDWGL